MFELKVEIKNCLNYTRIKILKKEPKVPVPFLIK